MAQNLLDGLTVYTARRLHTMDPGRPHAVAVADGRIVSVGSLDSMQPWLRRYPHTIDDRYADRVVLPGFIDPHTHLRMSGTYMSLNYLGPIDSAAPGGVRSGLSTRDAVLNQLRSLVSESTTGLDGRPEPITSWGYERLIAWVRSRATRASPPRPTWSGASTTSKANGTITGLPSTTAAFRFGCSWSRSSRR